MDEAKASWNTVYLDGNGFECQLTLRDEDEESLARRVAAVTTNLLNAGGSPVVRGRSGRSGGRQGESGGARNGGNGGSAEEKTYLDANGQRRCNLRRRDGGRCGGLVTERQGRYGLFWSCPDYRDHAQG
ncbi:MAG: hypothetical protein ACOC5K_04435, partial [Chloroflexota bacterium]